MQSSCICLAELIFRLLESVHGAVGFDRKRSAIDFFNRIQNTSLPRLFHHPTSPLAPSSTIETDL
jgi:hypothetical protein